MKQNVFLIISTPYFFGQKFSHNALGLTTYSVTRALRMERLLPVWKGCKYMEIIFEEHLVSVSSSMVNRNDKWRGFPATTKGYKRIYIFMDCLQGIKSAI